VDARGGRGGHTRHDRHAGPITRVHTVDCGSVSRSDGTGRKKNSRDNNPRQYQPWQFFIQRDPVDG